MKVSCKILLSVTLILFLNSSSFAIQDTIVSKKKLWIGINTADIFLKDPQLLPSAALIWDLKDNRQLRVEVGYDALNGNSNFDVKSTQEFSSFRVDTIARHLPFTDWQANIGVSYYQRKTLNPNFDVYFGAEVMYRMQKSYYRIDYEITQDFGNNNTQFIDIKEKTINSTQGYAISPLAGIQWKLSNGFRLGFESKALFLVQQNKENIYFNMRQSSSFNPQEFVQNTHHIGGQKSSISRLLPMSGLYLLVQL